MTEDRQAQLYFRAVPGAGLLCRRASAEAIRPTRDGFAERVRVAALQRDQLLVDRCLSLEAFGRVDEECRRIVGDRVLELDVVVADHQGSHHDHDRPHPHLQCTRAAGQARGHPAPAEHQQVEHDRRAQAVGERHEQAPDVEGL